MAELVTVAAGIIALLFLAPVIRLMPQATLTAVVLATTILMTNPTEFL